MTRWLAGAGPLSLPASVSMQPVRPTFPTPRPTASLTIPTWVRRGRIRGSGKKIQYIVISLQSTPHGRSSLQTIRPLGAYKNHPAAAGARPVVDGCGLPRALGPRRGRTEGEVPVHRPTWGQPVTPLLRRLAP